MLQNRMYADNLIEDEAETNNLLAKPTCFIIVGGPGVGKSALARKIAELWRCCLVDDTDILNDHIVRKTKPGLELMEILNNGEEIPERIVLQLILEKLNSPEVEHSGYVLSCLPFLSEHCLKIKEQIDIIKNLKLTPDFILHIKCPDSDLAERLSGLRQCPDSGRFYRRDEWMCDDLQTTTKAKENVMEEEEEDDEELVEDNLEKVTSDQMVWRPEDLNENVKHRLDIYRDIMLGHLKEYIAQHNPLHLLELDGNDKLDDLLNCVMSRLRAMAIPRPSHPISLSGVDDLLPEDVETEEMFRLMSRSKVVAPGFRWRRSLWGRACPVALKEGKFVLGSPDFCMGFQDKMYILSSAQACEKFTANPRRYLTPPMPQAPCRVSIIGPPLSGKSTLCNLIAQHHNAEVLCADTLLQTTLKDAEQARLERIKKEATDAAIENIQSTLSAEDDTITVTNEHPEVQALVDAALEEASQVTLSQPDLCALVLENRIREIEDMATSGDAWRGWVLENFPKNLAEMEAMGQAGILPDIIFCLKDGSDNHCVLKRLYERDSVDKQIRTRLLKEQGENEETFQHETEAEEKAKLAHILQTATEDTKVDDWELGYPVGPEMDVHKQQIKQFMADWDQVQAIADVQNLILDTSEKKPETLLEEVLSEMNKPFRYVATELTSADLEDEQEDMAQLQTKAESDDEDEEEAEEEEEGKISVTRSFGDTYHFCPVALKNSNVLVPCNDGNAAKYRERIYYFSSPEARDVFIQNPEQYVARKELLKPPALRVFMLGIRGSGKTMNGKWLAEQLGLFYIDFRANLQMLVLEKTKKPVAHSDEADSSEEGGVDLDAQIRDARGEVETEVSPDDAEKAMGEVQLTDDETNMVAYLSDGEPLSPHILDMILMPFWKEEPYKSTGFILEGFPSNSDEVDYLTEQHLFPDIVVTLGVDVGDVQERLLPKYLNDWKERCDHRQAKVDLLRQLLQNIREENIALRRAELMENGLEVNKDTEDEEEGEKNPEEDIERRLEQEFPPEAPLDHLNNEETKEAATERLQTDIARRFQTDDNNISAMKELLAEHNIAIVTINAGGKSKKVQRQLFNKVEPLLSNRESLFQKCQIITSQQAHKLLTSSYKYFSAFGFMDPTQLYHERDIIHPPVRSFNNSYQLIFNHFIYFFASKENCNTFMQNPLKYICQPKPTSSLPVKLAIIGPPKSGKTTVAETFAQEYGLVRLSVGSALRVILETRKHTGLGVQILHHLNRGDVVPDELAVQAVDAALNCSVYNGKGYVLDGFPVTLKQAKLMASQGITPMVVAELQVDILTVLNRGTDNKNKPSQPYPKHNSPEILNIQTSCFNQEAEFIRKHFQHQHKNWIQVDGLKSKWWISNHILSEVSKRVKQNLNYLEKTQSGQAASIHGLCITPEELERQIGTFEYFCPVCLILDCHLVDCSEIADLTHAAKYMSYFYIMCGDKHLELFLKTPEQFTSPDCAHKLPPPHLRPKKLTEIQVKGRFPQHIELRGFCPVTYHDGKHRYEALVQGKTEFAVEYRERIYVFENRMKQEKFLRTPEIFWDQKLPAKTPPLCEPLSLSSLPTLGYLEQGVGPSVVKAMTAVGCLKPKYPFLSVQKSALLYVGYYLKAFNPKSTDFIQKKYKKKLAVFEENCALIPYLLSNMQAGYRPPSEQPMDFQFKLNLFLSLDDK